MAPEKINIKERLSDGEIDLSMSDLQDVPIKDIAPLKKATSLDLSNNHLNMLPVNFATLTHLTKLDLSKNQLTELPENFGDLVKLKYLDLYQNQLQYLPLSFNKLKSLKWLDLKGNPLVEAVAKVAGPCLDAKQCQICARDVVIFFTQVQEQISNDIENRQKQKQKQLEINCQKEMDNKKMKKKDKAKHKKGNGEQAKENAATLSNKMYKKSVTIQNCQISTYRFKLLFLSVVSVLAILFLTTSVKYKHTLLVENIVVNVYNMGMNLLPQGMVGPITRAASYMKLLHDHIGIVTLKIVDFVLTSHIYLSMCDILAGFVHKV